MFCNKAINNTAIEPANQQRRYTAMAHRIATINYNHYG